MTYSNYEGMNMEGSVLRLERSSIFDGDGYRTVIFLKGCPLRCQWCSTPESHHLQIEPTPAGSITYGRIMTVEEIMKEVRKDIPFYFHSGGGMTVSGGEILVQPDFVRTLLKRACWEGIDTAIETTMFGSWDIIEPILDVTCTAFVDLKFINSQKHKQYTGVSNERILENIKKAGTMKNGYKLIIRTPLIPGINDSEEELDAIGRFLAELPNVDHLQFLPYHRLGTDTYRKLGIPYQLSHLRSPSEEHMEWCRSIAGKYLPVNSHQ